MGVTVERPSPDSITSPVVSPVEYIERVEEFIKSNELT